MKNKQNLQIAIVTQQKITLSESDDTGGGDMCWGSGWLRASEI